MGAANQAISAGLGGFLALFVMAGMLWLLARSLLKHLRVVEHTTYEGDEDEAETETLHARPGATDGETHGRRGSTWRGSGRRAPE